MYVSMCYKNLFFNMPILMYSVSGHSCALTKKLHQDMRKFQESEVLNDEYTFTENNKTILDLELERLHNDFLNFNQRFISYFCI